MPKALSEKRLVPDLSHDTTITTIHIYVALCDNKYQGIVPVPKSIGNGQDPNSNLYWGCENGIRSYFKRSREWKLVSRIKKDKIILERLVFKHLTKNAYLIADAYDGKEIIKCTEDFLAASSGNKKDTLHSGKSIIGIGGNSQLLAYIGHDGLMDFQISKEFKNTDEKKKRCHHTRVLQQKIFCASFTAGQSKSIGMDHTPYVP
jgi:hypothetical protein